MTKKVDLTKSGRINYGCISLENWSKEPKVWNKANLATFHGAVLNNVFYAGERAFFGQNGHEK